MTPSPNWKEVVAPGETEVFEQLAKALGKMQTHLAQKAGAIQRALHAKATVAARAQLEVLAGIPAHARVGLFGEPKRYDAVVRFSNGAPVARADSKPDVRGMAVKVIGVGGKKLIPGLESCVTQDFLTILTASQPFLTPEDFVFFVLNMKNPLTLIPKALVRLGPARLFALLRRLQKSSSAAPTALHQSRFYSALPIRYGTFAAKYSFVPVEAGAPQNPVNKELGAELEKQLAERALSWELQMQFFVDEKTTPIEDPTVEWTGPWVPVARLTVPKQSVQSEKAQQFKAWVESLSFDPWHAQEEFRPIGAMMRARNAAYRVSTQNRKAAAEPTELPS